ncbi:hypothetical protein DYB26_016360, partial [Aphanomyces astaci]
MFKSTGENMAGRGAPAPQTQRIPLVVDETAEVVKMRFLNHLRSEVSYEQQAELMRQTETSSLFVDYTKLFAADVDLAQA